MFSNAGRKLNGDLRGGNRILYAPTNFGNTHITAQIELLGVDDYQQINQL